MKRRVLALCLVAVLALTAIGGATLAYFTDKDEATNAFAVGGVEIDLHEDNKEGAVDEEYQEWLEDQVLMPGDEGTNAIAKVVTVENTGKSDAYVRVHIAIPTVLDNTPALLHMSAYENSYVSGKWNWGQNATDNRTDRVGTGDSWNTYTTTIDDILYNVYVVTYETALAPEGTTVSAIHQVYLDKDVDHADVEEANEVLDGSWKILVVAEGCQAEGFEDAFDALNTSFGVPGSDNNPWAE